VDCGSFARRANSAAFHPRSSKSASMRVASIRTVARFVVDIVDQDYAQQGNIVNRFVAPPCDFLAQASIPSSEVATKSRKDGPFWPIFGEHLRKLRVEREAGPGRQWSQRAVELRANGRALPKVDKSKIGRAERAEWLDIPADFIRSVAALYEVSYESLVGVYIRERFSVNVVDQVAGDSQQPGQPMHEPEQKPQADGTSVTKSMIPLQQPTPRADVLATPSAHEEERVYVAEEPGLFRAITAYWDSVDRKTRRRMMSACTKLWEEFDTSGGLEKTGTGDERGNE
jgi:hypothetical protein